LIIETRSSQLHENLMGVAVNDHDDVNIEVAQSAALADIAEQVLSDARAVLARTFAPSSVGPSARPEGQPEQKNHGSGGVQVHPGRATTEAPSSCATQPELI
jgi:hypothetical protein